MSRYRNLARLGLVGLSKLMGLSVLKGLAGRNLYVVNYHSIAGADDDPYINRNTYRTVTEFEEDLRFYKSRFKILNAVDLINLRASREEIPNDAVIITFDDGLRINFDYQLPILKKYGITATFFLCSAFIDNRDLHYGRKSNLLRQSIEKRDDKELNRKLSDYLADHKLFSETLDRSLEEIGYRDKVHLEEVARLAGVDFQDYLARFRPYLDSAQIREMIDSGFTIGAHSVDHPRYSELALEEQVGQTVDSLRHIVGQFGLDYRLFAFPYSDDSLVQPFYDKIASNVDLTFGMGGFVSDAISPSIQRGDIESTGLPVADAFGYRLLLGCMHNLRRPRRNRQSQLKPAL